MNAKEILDGCDHMVAACRHGDHDAYGISVCRACADRAVEAAREEERARIIAVVRRCVDGAWREALVADIEDLGRSP